MLSGESNLANPSTTTKDYVYELHMNKNSGEGVSVNQNGVVSYSYGGITYKADDGLLRQAVKAGEVVDASCGDKSFDSSKYICCNDELNQLPGTIIAVSGEARTKLMQQYHCCGTEYVRKGAEYLSLKQLSSIATTTGLVLVDYEKIPATIDEYHHKLADYQGRYNYQEGHICCGSKVNLVVDPDNSGRNLYELDTSNGEYHFLMTSTSCCANLKKDDGYYDRSGKKMVFNDGRDMKYAPYNDNSQICCHNKIEDIPGGEAETGGFCSDQSTKTYYADSGKSDHKKRVKLSEERIDAMKVDSASQDVQSSCGSPTPLCKHTQSQTAQKGSSHCGTCDFQNQGCIAFINP